MPIKSAAQAMQIKNALLSHKSDLNFARIAGFASAEHLGHTVAYDLAENYDPKIPLIVVDEDGKTREYAVTPIETKNPAIVGFILVGKQKDNPSVHVVFRGTADKASVVRDLEYGGAGQKSFYAEKDLILSQIDAAIGQRANECDSKIKLSISGHSLGGSDAQNCFAAIMDAMVRMHGHKRFKEKVERAAANIKKTFSLRPSGALATSTHAPLTMVDSITLNHVNSGGITYATAERCKKSAKYLAKCGVNIRVRALRVAGDGIQQTGQTNVLADIDPRIAKVEVLKINTAHEGWFSPKTLVAAAGAAYFASPLIVAGALGSVSMYGTVQAHTSNSFDKPLDKDDYLHFDNSTPDGAAAVKSKLSNKALIDNNPISHGLKKLLHFPLQMFVADRKVAPHIVERHEEFAKNLAEFAHDDKLLETLITEDVPEEQIMRIGATSHTPKCS